MRRFTAHDADMTEADDGEYVAYSDVEELLGWLGMQMYEIERLRRKRWEAIAFIRASAVDTPNDCARSHLLRCADAIERGMLS